MPSGIGSNIKLVVEWLPAIHFLRAIGAAQPGHDRALEVIKLTEFLASKTDSPIDDELVQLIKAIMVTPQAQQLVDYLTEKVRSLNVTH